MFPKRARKNGLAYRGRRLGMEGLEPRQVLAASSMAATSNEASIAGAAAGDVAGAFVVEQDPLSAVDTSGASRSDEGLASRATEVGRGLNDLASQPAAPVITQAARVGQTLRVTLSAADASLKNPLRADLFAESTDGHTRFLVGSRMIWTASPVELVVPIPEGIPVNPVDTRALTATLTSTSGGTLLSSAASTQEIQFETVTLHDIVWRTGQHTYDNKIVVIYDDNGENGVQLLRTAKLTITNSVLVLQDPLVMKGGTLSIVNSTIDDQAAPSSGNSIETSGASGVSLQDVTVTAGTWKKWKFQGTSLVTLNRVAMTDPRPWLVFTENAQVTSTGSPFHGSVGLNARATISGSTDTFVELIFDGGNAVVDEDLPEAVGSTPYVFPGPNDTGVSFSLSISNSTMAGGKWGLTMDCRDQITLRNSTITANLTLFDRTNAKVPLTGTLSGLTDRVYGATAPETITIAGVSALVTPKLTLSHVDVENWYPYAGPGNTLTVRNSVLADSAHSWGKIFQTATNVVENSTTSYVRANDYVKTLLTDTTVTGNVEAYGNGQITLTRAYVTGDVIASQNSVITIGAGSTILGRLITSGSGRIVTSGAVRAGSLLALGDAQVTMEGEAFDGAMVLRDAAVVRIKGRSAGPVEGVLLGRIDGYSVYVSAEYAGSLRILVQPGSAAVEDDGPVLEADWLREWGLG